MNQFYTSAKRVISPYFSIGFSAFPFKKMATSIQELFSKFCITFSDLYHLFHYLASLSVFSCGKFF